MLKKIWQSFMRWFRKLFGTGKHRSSLQGRGMATDRLSSVELPPLDDTDREYLFMQLLEGVAHGWQQPRAIGFFNKIRQRVRKSEWLEWLDKFGQNLLAATVPNYELAGRMVQLAQLDCGEIGDLAGDYGARLLNRQAEEFNAGMLPIMEFGSLETGLDEQTPFDLSYSSTSIDDQFGDIPPELLLTPPPPQAIGQPEPSAANETREITLEEFSVMLHQDPALVAELAGQFGIETTDPQIVFDAVVAQMQQQVQQISGDLQQSGELPSPTTPPEVPATPPIAPPEIPATPPTAPPEIPTTPPLSPPAVPATPPTAPPMAPEAATAGHPIDRSAREQSAPPPPPPLPRLEYKSEDPWSNNPIESPDATQPKAANLSDRRGV
ncbi:hypothetical protein [Chamaesiphon sp. VAR_69_metabat_338]|uniref:hypothetical protein n=1 Tax=Chamaesiphon sp. VAR_69_metabat_338 TaxID=2964704 RepID=UPI00286E617F|nr:hypothetical protein [Chamaesiphon sp. VAR_69_metabat_338]